MARYQRRGIVSAEQFLPEEEKIPEGVHPGTVPFSRAPGYYVDVPLGRRYLLSGDYIVTDDQGQRSVIPQGKFEFTYEIIDEPNQQKD